MAFTGVISNPLLYRNTNNDVAIDLLNIAQTYNISVLSSADNSIWASISGNQGTAQYVNRDITTKSVDLFNIPCNMGQGDPNSNNTITSLIDSDFYGGIFYGLYEDSSSNTYSFLPTLAPYPGNFLSKDTRNPFPPYSSEACLVGEKGIYLKEDIAKAYSDSGIRGTPGGVPVTNSLNVTLYCSGNGPFGIITSPDFFISNSTILAFLGRRTISGKSPLGFVVTDPDVFILDSTFYQ